MEIDQRATGTTAKDFSTITVLGFDDLYKHTDGPNNWFSFFQDPLTVSTISKPKDRIVSTTSFAERHYTPESTSTDFVPQQKTPETVSQQEIPDKGDEVKSDESNQSDRRIFFNLRNPDEIYADDGKADNSSNSSHDAKDDAWVKSVKAFDRSFSHLSVDANAKKPRVRRKRCCHSMNFRYIVHVAVSMLTGAWFPDALQMNLSDNLEGVYDRLLSQWETMSIVGSLMLSISYSAFQGQLINPIPVNSNFFPNNQKTFSTIAILYFVATFLFLFSLCTAILLTMSLMTIKHTCALRFIHEFKYLITVPAMTLVLGLYIFLVATVLAGVAAYGTFIVCAIVIVVAMPCAFMAIWIYLVLGLDRRGGIWEDSKSMAELNIPEEDDDSANREL